MFDMARKILITNDDGVFADGLIRLAKAAKEFGEVWVVAPESQRSAASHTITLHKSFDVWKVDFPVEGVAAYACDASPADCVRVGVLNIVPGKPDVCFSGINNGYNVASDLQYSATVGAAFEASFQKIPVIAFSECDKKSHEVTDRYLKEIIEKYIDKPHMKNQIWNVNFPGCTLAECKGVLEERKVSSDEFYKDSYNETKVSGERSTFMVEGKRNLDAAEGTDLKAVLGNFVSVGSVTNIS